MSNQLQFPFSDIIGSKSPVQQAIKLCWQLINDKPETVSETKESKSSSALILTHLLGYASRIMQRVIANAKAQGRKGCVLTCKEELIGYYEKFGFKNRGISPSALAGEVWYDMALLFL